MSKLTPDEKETVLRKLYEKGSKNEQDVYLHGFMDCRQVARRRPDGEDRKKNREVTFSYYIRNNNLERHPVCKAAFLSLHSISNSRLQRLNKLLVAQMSPRDLRGTHNNRPHVLKPEIITKIQQHIESFPYKISHYSSKEVHYLDSALNVKIMYNLFGKLHPNLKNTVKYEFYLKFFKENFALKFGRPQVDVCSQCEELGTKLKDQNLNDNAKRVAAAELMIHKRRANKFYSKLKEITALCHERNDVGGIVFDYIQNMPLPVIPVQEMFYLRQLWLYGFEIHDLKKDTGHFYTYHEGQAAKGPNEVCTFINDYVQKMPAEIQELHIFSDGCPGQNRNNTVVRYLLALAASKRFRKIHQYFPVRGHSFLPCDRDFGSLKRVIRKYDRIYVPEDYENMILSCRKLKPFTTTTICYTDIIEYKNWWPNHYKKTCQSSDETKAKFAISNYRQFIYDSSTPGYVITSDYIGGLVTRNFKLIKPKAVPTLPTAPAYSKMLPINVKKIENLKKVMQYMTGEILEFFYHITSLETTNMEADD